MSERHQRVKDMLLAIGGSVTRAELGNLLGLPIQTICPLVKTLIEKSEVTEGDRRVCSVTNNKAHILNLQETV